MCNTVPHPMYPGTTDLLNSVQACLNMLNGIMGHKREPLPHMSYKATMTNDTFRGYNCAFMVKKFRKVDTKENFKAIFCKKGLRT